MATRCGLLSAYVNLPAVTRYDGQTVHYKYTSEICPLLAQYEIILPAFIHAFIWLCHHHISGYTIFFNNAHNFFPI